MPAVRVFFVDATDADFEVVQSGTELRNIRTLTFQDFKLKDGTVVTAHVPSAGFKITLEGSQLDVRFEDVNFEWTPGVTAHYTFTAGHTAVLDGNRRIELIQGEQNLSAAFSMSSGVIAGEVAAAVGEAVVFALMGYGVGRLSAPVEDPPIEMAENGQEVRVPPVAATPTPGGGLGDPANGLNSAGSRPRRTKSGPRQESWLPSRPKKAGSSSATPSSSRSSSGCSGRWLPSGAG